MEHTLSPSALVSSVFIVILSCQSVCGRDSSLELTIGNDDNNGRRKVVGYRDPEFNRWRMRRNSGNPIKSGH